MTKKDLFISCVLLLASATSASASNYWPKQARFFKTSAAYQETCKPFLNHSQNLTSSDVWATFAPADDAGKISVVFEYRCKYSYHKKATHRGDNTTGHGTKTVHIFSTEAAPLRLAEGVSQITFAMPNERVGVSVPTPFENVVSFQLTTSISAKRHNLGYILFGDRFQLAATLNLNNGSEPIDLNLSSKSFAINER